MTSVWFCKKKLQFSVRCYKINCGFRFFGSVFCTVYCLMCMTYFRAELVQLTVSRSDSELEVQRYGTKKSTLTVDPIMLEDELWMKQREKLSPNHRSRKSNCRSVLFSFSKTDIWQFHRVPHTQAYTLRHEDNNLTLALNQMNITRHQVVKYCMPPSRGVLKAKSAVLAYCIPPWPWPLTPKCEALSLSNSASLM